MVRWLLVAASAAAASAAALARPRCDAVADCGAVPDNATLADRVLTACAARCGAIVFPPHTALRVASVDVSNTSGLSLEFGDGASWWASPNASDYPLAPFFPRAGATLCYRAVLWGRNVADFALTGPTSAIIDGAGAAFQPGRNTSAIQTPKLFELVDVANATITGMTFQNAANWHIHFLYCRNVRFLRNTVLGPRAWGGTDGIDPSSCSDVLIDGAYIDVGDDAVAVTAGGAHDLTGALMPTTRVTVRNSYLRSRNFAIGSATFSNVSEVLVTDTRIGDDEGSAAWGIKIKSHEPHGGDVSNITFRNVRMGVIAPNAYQEPNGGMAVAVYSDYRGGAGGKPSPYAPSRTHNVSFINVTAVSARWAAQPLAGGGANGSALGPLHFVDVDFGHVSERQPWVCSDVAGTTVTGVLQPAMPRECGL